MLLGIDPGLASTGYGVVRSEGSSYRCLAHGCLRTSARADIGDRLLTIHEAIVKLIRQHQPAVMVIERLYQLRDGATGLSVGQAMGVVRLAAAQAGLPVADYAPTHVKLMLVGNGQAAKHQVQFMVQRLLNLDELPRPDHAADALALCICHLHSGLSRSAGPPPSNDDGLPELAALRVAAALAAEDERRRTLAAPDEADRT